MVVVANELGVDINCDEEGNFSARVNGEYVRFKNIKKVKEAIQHAAPTVDLVDLTDKGRGYYHNTLALTHVKIAALDRYNDHICVGRPSLSTNRYSGARYYELHEPDAAVEQELKAINLDYTERVGELTKAYDEAIATAKAKMVRVTPERFAELLAAKIAEGANE